MITQAGRDPVADEHRDRVLRDEPQQPGDRGVGDDERHTVPTAIWPQPTDGGVARPRSSNSPAPVSAGIARKNDSRVAVDPVDAEQQAGGDRGAGAGHARDQREALDQRR